MIVAIVSLIWSVAMRRLLLAAVMCGAITAANAADLPILRGGFTDGLSTASVNWEGFYIGGQAGYGSSDENFTGSTSNMLAALLQNTTIENGMGVSQWNLGLGKDSAHAPGNQCRTGAGTAHGHARPGSRRIPRDRGRVAFQRARSTVIAIFNRSARTRQCKREPRACSILRRSHFRQGWTFIVVLA